MNRKLIITVLLAIVVIGLVSCNSDNDYEDKVEQVTFTYLLKQGYFIMFLTPRPRKG